MKFYELSHIGAFHVNHNEDCLISEAAGNTRQLIGVMDGCSSGTDSHFASTLMAKVIRKIAKQEAYREYAEQQALSLTNQLERVAVELFEQLSQLNRLLDLRSDELLSTLILALVDTKHKKAEILIVGDGLIHLNGKMMDYDSDNKPDYIGYHLHLDKNLWYHTRTKKLSVDNLDDLSICTDGIYTFRNVDGKTYEDINQETIMHQFFIDKSEMDNDNKLKKTLIDIQNTYGLIPSDDITMIRVINR